MTLFSVGEGHRRHHPFDDKLFADGDNRGVASSCRGHAEAKP
jgi:hypothetical protein